MGAVHRLLLLALLLIPVTAWSAERPERPFLGVVPDDSGSSFDGSSGVVLRQVINGSTAHDLGLRAGDELVRFNGTAVRSVDDLRRLVVGVRVGDPIVIDYQRDGQPAQVQGAMQAMPSADNRAALRDTAQERDRLRENVAAMNRETEALLGPGVGEAGNMLQAMNDLNRTLDVLPGRIQTAAEAFREVYPHGEFTVEITIRISTDTRSQEPIRIRGGNPEDDAGDGDTQDGDAEEADGGDQAD